MWTREQGPLPTGEWCPTEKQWEDHGWNTQHFIEVFRTAFVTLATFSPPWSSTDVLEMEHSEPQAFPTVVCREERLPLLWCWSALTANISQISSILWCGELQSNRTASTKTSSPSSLVVFRGSARLVHLLSEEVTLEESKEDEETAGNKEMQLVMMNWSYYHRRLNFKSWSVS